MPRRVKIGRVSGLLVAAVFLVTGLALSMVLSQVLSLPLGLVQSACAQSAPDKAYRSIIQEAEAAYKAKEYAESASLYSRAFQANGSKGTLNDRYNAACSWALAGKPDSAFSQLTRIVGSGAEVDYDHVLGDPDLASLHGDARWTVISDDLLSAKAKAEAKLDKPLAARLDTIFRDDQALRDQFEENQAKYGPDSKEFRELIRSMTAQDSVNVLKVTEILDHRGWLGADVVSRKGNAALFLVIQHADLAVQEKYLPMMREAAKNGKASAASLALLEDRVNLREGKRQIYGSQIGLDEKTGLHYVLPLEDPDHVDKRRAEVGLEPLTDYVSRWDIKWDVAAYKKSLPEIEEREKAKGTGR